MEWVEWLMLIKVDILIRSKFWEKFLQDINKKKCGEILWDNIEKQLVIVEDKVNILMIMFLGNMKYHKVVEKHFNLKINFHLLSLIKKYKKKHMIIWMILNINLDRVNENWWRTFQNQIIKLIMIVMNPEIVLLFMINVILKGID